MTNEFDCFILHTPHLNLTYSLVEKFEYYVVIRDCVTGFVVWCGVVPRIQYERAYETYLRQKEGK